MSTDPTQQPSIALAADATAAVPSLLRSAGSPFGTTAIQLPYGSYVSIYHPGYSENLEIFSLPAYDASEGIIGVHYGTVAAACQIVACNQAGTLWDEDALRVDLSFNDILAAGVYYYYILGIIDIAALTIHSN